MITDYKIRQLCNKAIMKSPENKEVLRRVQNEGLRFLFDGYSSEYARYNRERAKPSINITTVLEKVSCIEKITNSIGCKFSDLVEGFIKDHSKPERLYVIDGIVHFFLSVLDVLTLNRRGQGHTIIGKIELESCDPVILNQVQYFVYNREWERWFGYLSPYSYRHMESQFEIIFLVYVTRMNDRLQLSREE